MSRRDGIPGNGPNRREVLAAGGAWLALTPLLGAAACAAPDGGTRNHLAPFSISLAEWSLHRALFAGALDNLDFPAEAARAYGIAAVEYVNVFFKDKAQDALYLADLKRRAAEAGVINLLIMVDGEGDLAVNDGAARARAIENHVKWLEAAAALGCHSIRVNAAGDGEPDEQQRHAADSLSALGERAAGFGLNVIVENHGGLSSDGSWLAGVMRRADHPRVGTLPDFGNFRIEGDTWYDRYLGVEELMPFARAVSAKSHDFDAAGNELHTDYERMLGIVLASGYHGWVGIEYEGNGLPEPEGIRRTKALLERVRARIA